MAKLLPSNLHKQQKGYLFTPTAPIADILFLPKANSTHK